VVGWFGLKSKSRFTRMAYFVCHFRPAFDFIRRSSRFEANETLHLWYNISHASLIQFLINPLTDRNKIEIENYVSHHIRIMFATIISRSFADSMAGFTETILSDAIERLSAKYNFDKAEAMAFLMTGGVQVKLPTLEKSKLPWTGVVDESCCRAILKNDGLFTQCQRPFVNGTWCKKCAKDVEKHGTPPNGDVDARLITDIMKYKVGKFEVKPYIEYMDKKGITQEQVDEAVHEYGLTIDPRQYEKKKRGRRTTAREMMPAEMTNSSDDEHAERRAMSEEDRLLPEDRILPEFHVQADVLTREDGEIEESDEELDEDDYVPPTLTLQGITEMKKEEILKVCMHYGINTAQPLKTLRLELKGRVV